MLCSDFSKMVRSGSRSVPALRKLHQKRRDRPMSLADACVVRMAEIHDQYAVLTLDSDFTVYRKQGHEPLTLLFPVA